MDAARADELISNTEVKSLTGWLALYYEEATEIETPEGTFEYVDQKKFGADTEYDPHPVFLVVRCGDQYFQKEGYHDSWEGSAMDGECVEVEPYEVPLTFYRHK